MIDAGTLSAAQASADQARTMAVVARARITNGVLRFGASVIVAIVAATVVGNALPLYWMGGMTLVLVAERVIFKRLLAEAEAGRTPKHMGLLVAWIAAQSIYGNLLAVLLWFSAYLPGETLAVMYILGGLANAAATLRASPALSFAGAGPTVAFMLGLPLADYLLNGTNALDLMPLVAGLLVLGFGMNLWRSLLASDSAQAQAEAAVLRERQAAAAAAAAKTDMIQRMNDELRTPMTALVGAAEHLRRAAASPQARAHIATIVQAGELLKMVLDDLSDLDRLENGALPIEAKPADPREIVRGVVAAFRPAAQDKNLELFLDVGADVPAEVEIDPLRVRQVLFNLLANAVRYTTHGGVRVGVHAQASTEAGRVRLTFVVADTGVGMSRSQLALIFGRGRLSSEGKGPGIGLAISLRLARLMGGQLTAKSELGEGSVFSFALEAPVRAAARAPTKAA